MTDDLRFADVVTFLCVQRCASITGAARALKVTGSQVSKAVHRLEEQLGAALLVRSSRGVQLTEAGRQAVPRLEEVVSRLHELKRGEARARELTVAAPSYLQSAFLPAIAGCLPSRRLRGIELPPALVRAYMVENQFEAALMMGDDAVPASWTVTPAGAVRKALFGSPSLRRKLGRGQIDPAQLRALEFVAPLSNFDGHFLPGDDGCPLTVTQRRTGHQAQTLLLGLELAAATGQLIYGPEIAARPWLERGTLVEIPVRGWESEAPLMVACNGERMRASEQRAIVEAVRAVVAGT